MSEQRGDFELTQQNVNNIVAKIHPSLDGLEAEDGSQTSG